MILHEQKVEVEGSNFIGLPAVQAHAYGPKTSESLTSNTSNLRLGPDPSNLRLPFDSTHVFYN